ncbi:hypothetical protein CRENBAI_009362, partial [Crenichthys baileyi]
PPSAPQNLVYNINQTTVNLEWSPPADTGGRNDVTYGDIPRRCAGTREECVEAVNGVSDLSRTQRLFARSIAGAQHLSLVLRYLGAHSVHLPQTSPPRPAPRTHGVGHPFLLVQEACQSNRLFQRLGKNSGRDAE